MVKKYIFLFFILLVVLISFFVFKKHSVESFETVCLELDVPYFRIVSLLSKKESFESIVASGGGKLLDREWKEFKFNLKRIPRISTWEMRGNGEFKVLSDGEAFKGEMLISQKIEMNKNKLWTKSSMTKACGHIVSHETETTINNSDPSILTINNKIVYSRWIPFWYESEVNRRVNEYNKKHIESIKNAIIKILN